MKRLFLGLAAGAALMASSLVSSGANAAMIGGASGLRGVLEDMDGVTNVGHRCYRRWNGYYYETYCEPHRYERRRHYDRPRPYYRPY